MDILKKLSILLLTLFILTSTLGCTANTKNVEYYYKKTNPNKNIIHLVKNKTTAFILYCDKDNKNLIGADELKFSNNKWKLMVNRPGSEANQVMFTSIGKVKKTNYFTD